MREKKWKKIEKERKRNERENKRERERERERMRDILKKKHKAADAVDMKH